MSQPDSNGRPPYRLADTPARDVPTGTPSLSELVGERIWITGIEWQENQKGRYVTLQFGRRDGEGKALFGSANTSSKTVMEQLQAASRQGSIWKAQGGPGLSVYVCQSDAGIPGMKPRLFLSDEPQPQSELKGTFGKRGG